METAFCSDAVSHHVGRRASLACALHSIVSLEFFTIFYFQLVQFYFPIIYVHKHNA